MRRIRIGWRLTLWHATVVAAILVWGGLATYWSTAATFRSLVAQQLRHAAATIMARVDSGRADSGRADSGRADVQAGGYQAALTDRDLLTGLDPIVVEVLAPDGTVVNRSAALHGVRLPPLVKPGQVVVARFRHGDWVVTTHLLAVAGVRYRLELATPWEPMAAILRDLRRVLVGVGLVGSLLAVAGGAILARAALARVDAIRRAAEAIGATDLSARLPLRGPQDELGRLAVAFNAMLDRIQEAHRRQADFVADASHELRTPTTIIRGVAGMLRRWAAQDPRVLEQSLEIIERQAEYLGLLVADLLTLARGDSGVPHPPEAVRLDQLASLAVQDVQPVAGRRTVRLEPLETAVIAGDPVRLRQLLNCLLDNALRFTDADGEIRVGLRIVGDSALLDVEDDGPGIAAEDLPRVFDRFYRSSEARARAKGGSGLGLAIAQAVAEEHGGTITASSTPGRGTRMEVRLPLLRPGDAPARPAKTGPSAPTAPRPLRSRPCPRGADRPLRISHPFLIHCSSVSNR